MYFNRKNAEQKNWRMIKKGKHFLFGCSLVFAVGASLATQVVHANTAETTVANNSTTGDVTPTPNGDGKTYEAPAAVAEIKSEVATTPAVAAKLDGETAKEVKALDKTKLENYIAEIEAKLANGTYESKTEESVAVLKADLEAAKATLANATTQDEITKAYSKLVTTANTKLKNKPVEKKETPAVDATNGQPTVGKKAENTEKKSESNSIENTGSNDSRNGKALDKNNAFRAEVAYSEGTNAAANGHSDTYILNDVNKATSTDDAVNAVSRVTNYKVKYNKDASGKITSLDWLVFYNDHAENLSNTYNTDGGDVYRNFIQIPAEVNMPTSITRAKYNSPIQGKLNPKTKKLERTKPDGSALSSSVTFENPAPATAAGLPLDKKDTFSLASGWESGIYGRSIEKLAGQEDRYFKSAASNSSPRTKELLDNVALNDKRLIVDRSTTGGSGYDGYAWSFRTEVPATTSNEQLKDMKVVFGMMRSATAGANAGFANIATNPIKMWQSDVSTPTAKDQTVKVGQKPDATKSIGNLDTLPKGTTVKYKDAVDTRTPGEKRATAVVTYPDKSTKEVPVKVIVEKEAVAPAKPVTPKPEAPKPSTPAPDAATNKPAAGAATNKPAPGAATNKPAPGAATNKPAAGAATSAPEIVNDLAGKASTPADVTVKAPAGSTVKLYNTDGVVIGEAVANAQGVATVHPTNSLPAGKITATSTPTGGKESAKSTPITITASPVTVKDGGVTGNDDTRLLVSRSEITVYPGDKIDVDVVAQATALEKFSVEKNPLAIRGVEPTGGYLGASNGATIRQRDAKYSGTVAMDQPAGETVVTFYAKNRDHGTNVSRDLKVIVLETAKKYEPVAGTKVDIVDSNGVSGAEKNKIIEAVKAANPSLPANSQYSVDEKGNLTITYPDGSKDKIAAAYLVNPGADAATSAPEIVNDLAGKASTPADVTVKAPAGSTVKLYNTDGVVIGEAVANAQGVATVHPTNSLPAGAITATSTPAGGKESAKSTPITVTASPLTVKDGGVTGNNDTRLLVSKSEITVYPGDKIDVDVVAQATALGKFSVEKNPLAIKGVEPTGGYLDDPRGSTIRQRDAKYSGTVAMDQPAGSTSVIFHAKNRDKPTTIYRELIVNVLETAKKYEPVAGTKLDVANSNNLSEDDKNKVIASVKAANPSLPADSQYSVDEKGNLTITYPDGSKDKIAAAYLVNPAPTDADKNTPTAKPQTVNKGTTPKAEDSIGNIKDLPKGTKVAFKAPVDTATPGEKDATVVVTYPDGSNEEVPVKVTVKAPSSASTTPTAPATPAAPVVAPTVEIPYSNKDTKEVYVYAGEENSFDIKFKDDSGKIASATVRQGGNKAFADVAGEANTINTQYGFKANVINAETPATEKAPAVITYSGTPAATDGLAKDKLEAATKGENPEGMALGWRYATATDKDGAFIENKAVGSSTATDPGAFRVMLKGQTQKYDIATPTEKVTVADPANVTDADLAKIKEKLQLEYSKNNDDANLADKKGKAVSDKDAKIQSVTKDDKGNLVVTYKDGSQDKKPLSEFVTKETTAVAPTVEIPYSNKDTKEVYVYAGEENSFDIKFKDDSGKIASATVRQGGNKAFADVAGEANTINTQYGFKANVINAETPATEKAPAVITYSGTPAATDGLAKDKLEAATKGENPEGMALGWRYATATDKDGAFIENKAVGSSTATDPGAFRVMLKGQTQKYDIATPTEKVTVADPANVTDADLAKIKEKLQLEYSKNNDDANLADKKGKAVSDKDAKIQSVTKDDKGNLVVTYKDGSQDKKPLSEFVTKKPTDADKNESPSKPEIKTDLTGKAGTKTPVEVTATPGSKVELFDKDGNKIGEGVAGKDGKATITPTKELPAGDVTAKETTPAGKVSEASTPAKATSTKDTTTPSKPEIKTDLTGKAGTKTPVEVTATPGSKVELFDKDGNKIGEGVAGKDGKATITPTKELPAGDVTAKETTPAGKVSEASTPAKATPTKDTTTPSKPEIKTDLTDKAGTKTPVEVTATPGSKVELFDKDGNKIGEGVAGKDGKATITPTKELPAGDVTAKETTPAGKVSEASTPAKATPTKDTTTPSKPEIKTDLTGKAGTKTPVEVTATPGSKVELFDKDGNKIGEGVAGKDGKATITPTKELPAGDVTAKETTPAGKVSEASTPAKATPTKDTTTPSKPEIKTDLTGKAGTKTPVEVTATPGSKVELFDKDGNKIGEGVAGKDGKATITPTKELPAGDVTAKETTPAGKVSEASTPAKATPTKDTTTPSKPEIKTDLTGKAGTKTPVEVTAEPGSKVELFDKDGNKIGEGVAGKDGKATITPTKELPAGDVTAKATDPAGNVSEPSAPEKATEDTKAPAKPEIKTDLTDKAGTKTPVEVTAEPGSKVELFDKDGNKIGEGVAGKDGKATITPTKELPAGDVTAKETTPAGKVSEASTPAKATPTKDTTTPSKPEIKTDLTGKAGTKTPVEVTATPGSKVELFDKDGNKIGEGVAGKDGKATITPTKELPAGDVTAKETTPAGKVSEASTPAKATPTKDTTTPSKPEIKTDLTGKAGTKTPVEVTAEPGSKVELFDKDGNKIGEGVAGKDGKATITPTKELPAGDVTAKATDPAGNVSEPSAPEKATEDTKAPAKPEIKTDLTDKAGTKTPVEVTAEPGSKVELFDKDGNKIGEGVAGKDGKATITPTKELPAGDVTAKETTPAGKVSEASTPAKATPTKDTTTPSKPEIKTDLTGKAGTKTPVEVTATPGSKVELFDKDGNKIGEGVAGKDGKATITPTKELPAGDVTAKETTPAGKVSEASTPAKATPTKDTTTPSKPEIKTDLTGKAGTKTPVEVTAEPGSKVELFDKDGNKIGEGVAGKDGKATITPTKELPAGDVTAKETTPAGKVSEASTPAKATPTKDTTTPSKPEIKTDLTGKAGTKTPVEVTAEPGSKVELFDKDGNKIGEGVAGKDGKATITPTVELPAGDVTAKATDSAGNVSQPSAPEKATEDTKAPAKPEIKTDLTDKAGTKTPVEVTAEPGSKVELFDKDGNKIGEGVADENGKATITPTVELPAGDVTAKATDPAGNVSEPSSPEKATEDTKAPAKPEIKTDLTDKAGTKTPVEVTAEPGSKVELFDKDGNKIGEGVAGKDGKATITPTVELPAGDVTAKATDSAGNVSQPSAPEKATEDTKAPAKPEIKTDLTDKAGTKTPVEVTAEPGSKVELFDKDGNKIGEGVADENGKATITPTVELPAGDVTAKATDPAGNVSEPSSPEKATEDTKAPAKPEIKTDLTDKAGTKTPVEVTAEPGSKVELFDKDGNKIGEGVAGKDGKATITPTVELPAGDVTAKATDSAGNVSQPSAPEKATEDTKAPAKPEIKTDLTDKAGTKTPVEVTAEPGSKVELFDKDGNKIGEGVADENGKATITPTKELPAGDVTAKATDPAGNVSEPSAPEKATEDTKAPAKPEIKTDLTDKAGTKTPVEVTAEPGSKVELFDKDGNKIGEGVADENGKATITPTKELPAGDVTAKATDPAGNVSQPSAPEKATEDTKAPAKPEIKTDLTDKAGTKTPVEVTAEPGSKVELFDKDGNKIGEGVADENGKATITPTVELPAGDVTAKATDPAGNVSEPSSPEKATEDTKAPAKPAVTPVVDPSNLTEAEKAKVADEVKKSNPTVTDVKVGKDGTTTVTFPDGTTAVISSGDTVKKSSDNVVKDPAVTPVVDPSNLTEAEKAKVAEAVKKSNPTVTDVKVGKDGTTTVTFPDGTTAVIPSGDTVKESSDKAVKDPAVTPVVDPSNLTEAEKAKVADEVKKSNPTVTDVKVGKDGTTTVTFPDGTTAVIPSGNAVKKSSDKAVKDPAVTPVVDPSNLTEAEKAKVADEVKKSNPTVTDVKVGKDGTTTVTFPDGTTAVIPSGDTVKKSSDKAVKDPAVTPVVDPSNLTEAEKAKVAEAVKKSNPTVTDVKVGKDGTTTVTFPDGTTAVIPSGDTVKKSSDKAVKDPAVTPVVDPSNLTEAEKAKVADEVKKSNPTVTDVKVGKDGTTTVTFPDGTTAVIPSGNAVKKSSDKAVKDPAVTPVVDPSNLTEAEKAKVADEVKKSNPTVTDVKVGKDGTTTVTFPDGTTAVIPSGNAVKKSSDKAVKDPAVTPVVDPSNLTEAEKAKVADEVKKSNPTVTDVKVGKDGTTTVTFPDGTTAVIPSGDTVKKSSDKAVKDPAVTPVVDPSNLTEAEKAKVAEAVKKSNPTATDVKVGKDGTTTVTFPDGTTAVIPADKAVTSAEQGSHAVVPAGKAVTSTEQGSHAATPAKKAGAKELPNTGTADSTVAMVAAAASALLGLGLAGRRRKEDEEA